ncbi:hypothetical protein JCM10212_005193 [Sporobolomyces blumeae]
MYRDGHVVHEEPLGVEQAKRERRERRNKIMTKRRTDGVVEGKQGEQEKEKEGIGAGSERSSKRGRLERLEPVNEVAGNEDKDDVDTDDDDDDDDDESEDEREVERERALRRYRWDRSAASIERNFKLADRSGLGYTPVVS